MGQNDPFWTKKGQNHDAFWASRPKIPIFGARRPQNGSKGLKLPLRTRDLGPGPVQDGSEWPKIAHFDPKMGYFDPKMGYFEPFWAIWAKIAHFKADSGYLLNRS